MRLYLLILVLLLPTIGYSQDLFNKDSYRGYFPKTDDDFLKSIINHPNLIHYDKTTMTPMYQLWNGPKQGIFKVDDSAINNPNTIRPWRTTVGLDESPENNVLTFIVLDKPITWWQEKLKFDDPKGKGTIHWEFPINTHLVEILLVSDSKGIKWACEVRVLTRIKSKKNQWTPRVYRPFETLLELNEALTVPVKKPTITKKKIIDPFNVFSEAADFHKLERFDESLVRDILAKVPFKSCGSKPWFENCNAPTTDETFHIVPKNYQGAFIEISRTTCMSCHSTTLKHAKDFPSFDKIDKEGQWDGRIRGADGIFSFHIFDLNGSGDLRKELLDSGKLSERANYDL